MAIRDFFRKRKKTGGLSPAPASTLPREPGLYKEDFYVAGVYYHMSSVKKLATADPYWRTSAKKIVEDGKAGQKIFHYSYVNKPVKLMPEPNNAEDKNAVIVQIAGEKVGYISRDDNVHVLEILKKGRIKYITASVRGGECKVVSLDGTSIKQDESVFISVRIAYSV